MKANLHHTTSEDVERMKEYQMNRHRKIKEMDAERKKNFNNIGKLLDFPVILNTISSYNGGVIDDAEEEE